MEWNKGLTNKIQYESHFTVNTVSLSIYMIFKAGHNQSICTWMSVFWKLKRRSGSTEKLFESKNKIDFPTSLLNWKLIWRFIRRSCFVFSNLTRSLMYYYLKLWQGQAIGKNSFKIVWFLILMGKLPAEGREDVCAGGFYLIFGNTEKVRAPGSLKSLNWYFMNNQQKHINASR